MNPNEPGPTASTDFIREIIEHDLTTGKWKTVVTRFPPEPNGYLHIGHAKAINIDFGMARKYGGRCHLRFDDTNPAKEEEEYVQAIMADVKWLGWDWGEHLYYASDYFGKMYAWAEQLIQQGKAFVDDLTAEEVTRYRGTLTEPGIESPYRNRSVAENIDLFRRMRAGEFPDGSKVLRAKIDMASPNLNLRDPVMYRILKKPHHRQGDAWCIYPMYDWAHGLEDSTEGVTHSLCSLEFENHRPLYDWFLEQLGVHHPQQIEFARLNLTFTVMSKRKLLELVQQGHVAGWDDPRMPTLAGLRRRGLTPEAIQAFCNVIGVAKRDSIVDVTLLENAIRDDLNQKVPRAMAVLRPLKVVIDSYPEGKVEEFEAPNFPDDPSRMGFRIVPFSGTLFIERDDFMEVPPKQFFRLSPGNEVRLRWAYIIKCVQMVKDEKSGEILEVHCTHDPESRSGPGAQRRVKGTIHWVSAQHASEAEVRLYDRLFTVPNPAGEDESGDFKKFLNPKSLEIIPIARIERSLKDAKPGSRIQFERIGFFFADPTDSKEGAPVFNRIVSLKDTWAKIQKGQAQPGKKK